MKKLLIVENIPLMNKGYQEYFEDRYETQIASTFVEAVTILRKWQPDLAIIDIKFPYKEDQNEDTLGFKLTEYIKAINRDIGVVICSAFDDYGNLFYEMVNKNAYLGIAYVTKGRRVEILDNALEKVSHLGFYIDPEVKPHRISVASFLSTLTDDELKIVPIAAKAIENLSERELQVVELLTSCSNSNDIAQRLLIKTKTVETHITNIYTTLDINNSQLNPRLLVAKAYMLYKITNP